MDFLLLPTITCYDLSSCLHQKKFDDESILKTDLGDIFNQKSSNFHEREIYCLPERWCGVVDTDGTFIIDNYFDIL